MIPACRFLLALLAVLASALPAHAQVVLSFYSRDSGSSFPHAFVVFEGRMIDYPDLPVAANYGFTAVHVSPAILAGPVLGRVETVDEDYVAHSGRRISFPITDDQYRAVMATVARWRALPGKAYDLNSHNCISFVADIARTVGMDVYEDPKLMKKPRSFIESLIRRNPGFANAQVATASAAAPTAAVASAVH